MAKTLRSRIAAVAVVALGAGLLQAAPAFASAAAYSADAAVGDITLADPAVAGPANVNTLVKVKVGVSLATGIAAGAGATLKAGFINTIPGGGAAPTLAYDYTRATVTAGQNLVNVDPSTNARFRVFNDGSSGGTTATSAATSVSGWVLSFTPTVAGTYSLQVWNDNDNGGTLNGSEASKILNITVGSAALTTIAVTQPAANKALLGGNNGAVVKVKLSDADGKAVLPTSTQTVTVSVSAPSALATISKVNGGSITAATSYNLGTSNFDENGAAFINVRDTNSAAETVTVTASLVGSTTVIGTGTVAFAVGGDASTFASGWAANTYVDRNTTSIKRVTSGGSNTGAFTVSTSATSHSFKIAAAASGNISLTLTDTSAKVFGTGFLIGSGAGYPALVQDNVFTTATTADATSTSSTYNKYVASFSVTATLASGKTYSLTAANGSASAQTVTGETAAAATVTVTPNDTIQSATGATFALSALLKDQFGLVLSNKAGTVSVAGRNATGAAVNVVTAADGTVAYTLTDASTSTTSLQDVVTFDFGSGITGTVTVNYVTSLKVGTVAGSNKTEATAASGTISACADGTEGDVAITATVKDANGNLMAGVPVVITLPANTALDSDVTKSSTQYTSASGVASFTVYSTKSGTYSFTYTAGGVPGTSYVKWAPGTSAARVVKVTVGKATGVANEEIPVTVQVLDGWGNAIPAVNNVTVSASGVGAFKGIALSSSQTTDGDGRIFVSFSSAVAGTATITASVKKTDYAQTSDGAALIGTTAAAGFPAGVGSASATITYSADSTPSAVSAIAASVATLQTAMSALVASTTATLTLVQAQIAKIMKKLGIK